ncbi:LysR family transcriptional regulator [Ramlibacter sp. G-1-2-2]|uniref:LysR family transcriptional regulator n=1 Tax=Ramlibacter agri TaxID=2728837 RepID=A0A848HE25_9BURK|nr:LysR family transcriptional regulator [Ramlibacter agri]NML48412.1 LysR family transcriptional regulator [Ramlibacter agri]
MNSSNKLINVTSRQLHAFLEVSRLQSFAKAAERIPMSPSGMSMLVKELEEQVGARLFDRNTRSVTLTDAGRRLLPVAERILDELRGLGDVIGGTEAAVRSRLDVAATPTVSTSLLPEVMRDFAASHPQVRVHLADVDVMTVRRKVLEGDADIGLGFFIKPAAGLVREPLCKFRLMCVSPPGTGPRGVGPDRTWRSLANLPLVSLPPDNPIQAVIETHLAGIGRANEDRPTMNLIGTLIGMVRAGIGHAIVPSFALDECLRHGLDVAMLEDPVVHIDLFVVSRRGAEAKAAALAFAQAVKEAAAAEPAVNSGLRKVRK